MASKKIIDPQAKRYRRRLITYIVIAVSALAIIFFIVLSYVGTLIGNYTIVMRNEGLNLALADNRIFANQTSRLKATSIPYTVPITADDLPEDILLDDIDGSHNGIIDEVKYNGDGMYLAYTFYMKNLGDEPISYEHVIGIENNFLNEKGDSLLEIVRLKFYKNSVIFSADGTNSEQQNHSYTIYAKSKTEADTVPTYDDKGIFTGYQDELRECISERSTSFVNDRNITVCSAANSQNAGRAESFYSDTELVHTGLDQPDIIAAAEVIRFTIVLWLEGEDPECVGEVLTNPSLLLSSKITALVTEPAEDEV